MKSASVKLVIYFMEQKKESNIKGGMKDRNNVDDVLTESDQEGGSANYDTRN